LRERVPDGRGRRDQDDLLLSRLQRSPDDADDIVVLEPSDEALIAALGQNGRATISELQKATAQSESTVRRRVDQLRTAGAVYYDLQYDNTILGRNTMAMLWLTVAPGELSAVGSALAEHREVSFAAAITGTANVVAHVQVPHPEALYRYLYERVGALRGVHTVESSMVLRQIKQLR
jgi:DNA-binding Lrp family transcriptional regulator